MFSDLLFWQSCNNNSFPLHFSSIPCSVYSFPSTRYYGSYWSSSDKFFLSLPSRPIPLFSLIPYQLHNFHYSFSLTSIILAITMTFFFFNQSSETLLLLISEHDYFHSKGSRSLSISVTLPLLIHILKLHQTLSYHHTSQSFLASWVLLHQSHAQFAIEASIQPSCTKSTSRSFINEARFLLGLESLPFPAQIVERCS